MRNFTKLQSRFQYIYIQRKKRGRERITIKLTYRYCSWNEDIYHSFTCQPFYGKLKKEREKVMKLIGGMLRRLSKWVQPLLFFWFRIFFFFFFFYFFPVLKYFIFFFAYPVLHPWKNLHCKASPIINLDFS